MTVRIQTLGCLRVFRADVELTRLEGFRLRAALLVYLAVERSASRDTLLSIFWPESDAEHARHALRQNLYALRQVVGPDWIEPGPREVRLADFVTTDFDELESALERGDSADAARAFGGGFLDGVHLLDQYDWEQWVDAKRAHAARLFRKACSQWVSSCWAEGDLTGGVEAARTWVERDPSDDEGHHALIKSLAEAGRPAEAIRHYASYGRRLAAEGLTPLEETRDLIERLTRTATAALGTSGKEAAGAPVEPQTPRVVPVGQESTLSLPTSTGERPSRLSPRRILAFLGVLIAVSAVALEARSRWVRHLSARETGTASGASRLAVLPFSYRGSDQYAYLADGLMVLLSRTLDAGADLRTVDPRAIATAAKAAVGTPLESEQLIARHLNATHVLLGEVVEAGGELKITARLRARSSAGGETVQASVHGAPDELFALVDELSAQILVGRHPAGRTPIVRTAAITTDSLNALISFLEGERLHKGLNGRYGRGPAYDAFMRAVEIDSTFALAWYRLSHLAYFSGAALARVVDFAEAADRHSEALPWRERQLLAANRLWARGAVLAAERAYREILGTYPDDVEAWFGLVLLGGYSALLGDTYPAHRESSLRVLAYEPEHFVARWSTVWAAASDRNWTQADSLMRLMWGGDRIPWQFQAVLAAGRDDIDAWGQVLSSVPGQPTAELITTMRWVNWYGQNPAAAREFARLLEDGEEAPQVKALARLSLAEYELAIGRRHAASEAFARLGEIDPAWGLADHVYQSLASHIAVEPETLEEWRDRLNRWDAAAVPPITPPVQGAGIELLFMRHDGVQEHVRLYLLGRLSTRLGDYDRAHELADEVEGLAAPADAGTISRDLAQSIRAHALSQQGRREQALAVLEASAREVPFTRRNVSWLFTQPQDRLLRGQLLASLGRTDEAERWLRSVTYFPESVLAGPGHLARAEFYERTRHSDKALVEYRALVELWREADAEYQPVVARARERIRHIQLSPARH